MCINKYLKRFVDQCDMCRKMFVRDSPAPTVGQKLVGGDCQVRSDAYGEVVHCFVVISFHDISSGDKVERPQLPRKAERFRS